MDTKISQKCNCKEILQELKTDCFDKLYGSEIFALIGENNPKAVINKPFSKMNINEISSALESFDDICNYNKDFAQLRLKYLLSKPINFNIILFRQIIKNVYSGYYYKKALFFLY